MTKIPAVIATVAVIAIFTMNMTPVHAQGVPGCRTTCIVKCQALSYPNQYFNTMNACIAYWAPKNLARDAAIKAARIQAKRERAQSR